MSDRVQMALNMRPFLLDVSANPIRTFRDMSDEREAALRDQLGIGSDDIEGQVRLRQLIEDGATGHTIAAAFPITKETPDA